MEEILDEALHEARRSKKVVEARAAKDEGRLKEMEEQLQKAKGKVDFHNYLKSVT